jgi:hypothetical protein
MLNLGVFYICVMRIMFETLLVVESLFLKDKRVVWSYLKIGRTIGTLGVGPACYIPTSVIY